jgi:phospholipid/cholesterol/gamma-HCH transport system permease protein
MDFLAAIGRTFLDLLESTGRFGLFTVTVVLNCLRPPFYFRLILRQIIEVGYYSLPLWA